MPGALSFQDVGMSFRLYRERVDTLKEAVLGRFRHRKSYDDFWALRHVSFDVRPGESVGLIGHNMSELVEQIGGYLTSPPRQREVNQVP